LQLTLSVQQQAAQAVAVAVGQALDQIGGGAGLGQLDLLGSDPGCLFQMRHVMNGDFHDPVSINIVFWIGKFGL
jgi:hypothetical protein